MKYQCLTVTLTLTLVAWEKQPTFGDVTTGFPAKWHLRNERRNSIWITRHYPDLGSSSDWLNQISHAAWPIRCTTQTWVEIHHQYGNFCAHFSDIILQWNSFCLRKQPTFCDNANSFPGLRNSINSLLMTCNYPDIGISSDWLKICPIQSEALTRSG